MNAPDDPNIEVDKIDDLLDHLVFRSNPDGSVDETGHWGEIRYWKNGKDITAKKALQLYVKGEKIKMLQGFINAGIVWTMADGTKMIDVEFLKERIKELRGNG